MTVATDPRPTSVRSTDLRLAHAHLRLGQYGFARAELETLSVRDELDQEGLADLAEARWRTGDLSRAGEAAQAYLDAGGDRTSVTVIAAEAAMADGRPADARRFADAVLARPDDLDAIFAGIPRSRVWRTAGATVEPEGGSPEVDGSDVQTTEAPGGDAGGDTQVLDRAELGRAGVEPDGDAAETPPLPPGSSDSISTEETPSASAHRLIAFAASALRDDRARAAVELSLVLRSEPSLAPAVLELIARASDGPASRSGAALEIVRGDAYRLIGRPREAEQAYARAVSILGGLSGPTR